MCFWCECYVVIIFILCSLFFFFKQKTAYEMRINDCSSDVCSSDLEAAEGRLADADAKISEKIGAAEAEIAAATASAMTEIEVIAAEASSEERRAGKECVSTCRSRWSSYH